MSSAASKEPRSAPERLESKVLDIRHPPRPGKLEVRDCFADSDLISVMKLVLSEGCIGETVAALDAMEQAATASDPVVQGVLRDIARDEQRHAELAYRFMRWALAQCTDEQRSEMACEAQARIAAFERTAEGVQFVAAREVARPLIEALFVEQVLGATHRKQRNATAR